MAHLIPTAITPIPSYRDAYSDIHLVYVYDFGDVRQPIQFYCIGARWLFRRGGDYKPYWEERAVGWVVGRATIF